MNENHLIIGLGGTGGKIIRAFKKTLYQDFRDRPLTDRKIEYLYIDSDESLMKLDEPTWKFLGKNLQLGKNQQLLIQGADLTAQMEGINSFPGIKGWIGSKNQWRDILKSVVGAALGGQKRRLGRFLFANKCKEFDDSLAGRVRDLQLGSTPVTFHILCGLAGGTGSGSIIDVISQIRKKHPDPKQFPVIVYALLPETYPKPGWDTGNYHANGYAALVEINALSVGAWKPHDISGEKDRLDIKDPFNGCYLFCNENENQLSVDVDKELPQIVADFLYQKLIAVDAESGNVLRRIETYENSTPTPESIPNAQGAERSRRFMTFGIKRLAIPEEEIREYMMYSFARQAALQMLFNNPSDTAGYLEEARKLNFREFAAQKENWQKWLMTDEHLCLSLGILPEEINNRKWKTINTEWQDFIPLAQKFVIENSSEDLWLEDLEKICNKRFHHDYRENGVPKFYEIKATSRKEQARVIRQQIEKEFFEDWRNGSRSIHEIVQILDALLIILKERRAGYEDKIGNVGAALETAKQKVDENREEWKSIGFLGKITGSRKSLLVEHTVLLQEVFTFDTWIEAWRFGIKLLDQVIDEITSMRNTTGNCEGMIADALKDFTDGIAARCTKKEMDLREAVVKFYNSEEVKDFTRDMVKDMAIQQGQTSGARKILVAQLGDNPDFSALSARIDKRRFIDLLEGECDKAVVNAHNIVCAANKDKAKQLGVSIIEKLSKAYAGNEEGLKKFIYALTDYAGNYLIFDQTEVINKGEGASTEGSKQQTFSVIMPKSPEHTEFRNALEKIFKGSLKGETSQLKVLDRDGRANEIALISITNLFPLRFVKQLATLKEKYEIRTSGTNAERIRTEIHCEGDGTQHPSLFLKKREEMTREGLPYVILGKILGVINERESRISGKAGICLITKDVDGIDNDPFDLGRNMEEAADNMDGKTLETIRNLVVNKIEDEYLHLDKQEALMKQVLAELEAIKSVCKYGGDDPVYKKFQDAGRKAMKIIRKEN